MTVNYQTSRTYIVQSIVYHPIQVFVAFFLHFITLKDLKWFFNKSVFNMKKVLNCILYCLMNYEKKYFHSTKRLTKKCSLRGSISFGSSALKFKSLSLQIKEDIALCVNCQIGRSLMTSQLKYAFSQVLRIYVILVMQIKYYHPLHWNAVFDAVAYTLYEL